MNITVLILLKFNRMSKAAVPADMPASAEPRDNPTAKIGAEPKEPILRMALAMPPMRAKRSPLDAPNAGSAAFNQGQTGEGPESALS
jgi:hypothetical protein